MDRRCSIVDRRRRQVLVVVQPVHALAATRPATSWTARSPRRSSSRPTRRRYCSAVWPGAADRSRSPCSRSSGCTAWPRTCRHCSADGTWKPGWGDRRLVPARRACSTSSRASCSASCGRAPTRRSPPDDPRGRTARSRTVVNVWWVLYGAGAAVGVRHQSTGLGRQRPVGRRRHRSPSAIDDYDRHQRRRWPSVAAVVAAIVMSADSSASSPSADRRSAQPTRRGVTSTSSATPRPADRSHRGTATTWSGRCRRPAGSRPKRRRTSGERSADGACVAARSCAAVQTLEPLAERRSSWRSQRRATRRGRHVRGRARTADEVPDGAVLCSHGDVIPETIAALVSARAASMRRHRRLAQGHGLDARTRQARRFTRAEVWGPPGDVSAGRQSAAVSADGARAVGAIWARRRLDQVTYVGGRPAGEALLDVRQRHVGLAEEAVLDDPEEAERIGVAGIELGRPSTAACTASRSSSPAASESLRGAAVERHRPAVVRERLDVVGVELDDLAVESRPPAPGRSRLQCPGLREQHLDLVARVDVRSSPARRVVGRTTARRTSRDRRRPSARRPPPRRSVASSRRAARGGADTTLVDRAQDRWRRAPCSRRAASGSRRSSTSPASCSRSRSASERSRNRRSSSSSASRSGFIEHHAAPARRAA